MRSLLLIPGIFCCFATLSASTCSVRHYQPPNDAEKLLFQGKPADALAAYTPLLAAHPADSTLIAGAVLANLREGNVTAAETLLSGAANVQGSATLLVARGNLKYRQGHISDADKDYAAAQKVDPCDSLGYLGEFRIANITAMHASALRLLRTAHALDPEEPQVRSAWLQTRPREERIAGLKKQLEDTGLSDEQKAHLQQALDSLQQAAEYSAHDCTAEPLQKPLDLPFVPMMEDPNHLATWGLEARVNGHTSRLILDSGASGLYVGRAQAQAMGLKPAFKTQAFGFGDRGPQSGYVAYADSITIGPLTFHNCRVDVSDRRSVIERDGLIGADIFRQFLIALDYPDHKIQLAPLPGSNAETTTSSDVDDEDGGAWTGTTDRYEGPELAGWTPAYTIHSHLFLPTEVNGKVWRLFMLDTGDGTVNISPGTARAAKIRMLEDSVDRFTGVSGATAVMYSGPGINLRFASAAVPTADIAMIETENQSRYFGVDVGGFIGFPVLRHMTIHLDYRDSMVKFDYDKGKEFRDPRMNGYDNACATQGQCEHN